VSFFTSGYKHPCGDVRQKRLTPWSLQIGWPIYYGLLPGGCYKAGQICEAGDL
jgi:hypothetical protein